MNAFDFETLDELEAAIRDVRDDDATRVLILTGTGRAFCTGIDIAAIQGQSAQEVNASLRNGQKMIQTLVNMEKPVIAAVNGVAAGAGCSIALACDIVIASSSATFAQSFVKVGLISDMGSMYFLPRMVGLARAKDSSLRAPQ